ncbi:MAG: DUF4139 domain-containing protein [Candidatus Sulfobium sp.]
MPKSAVHVTGLQDQTGVSVTVYNTNLGLIKDRRTISLPKGTEELRFMDVASHIIPTSVYIKSEGATDGFRILEQNYEYDLLNPQKLLDKYVGKEVKLYYKNPFTEREEIVRATLLSNNGKPIFRIGDEITFGHPGRIVFPRVPESLISKPTLVWLVENRLPSPQNVQASYLTTGISWNADYVVTLDSGDEKADLSAWVTIENKSGAAYRNASLKLVAGQVHRVTPEQQYRGRILQAEAAKQAPQFREEEFFEYHVYTLQRPSTISNNQTKQIRLISSEYIPIKKELVYSGSAYYYRSRYGGGVSSRKIGVFVEMRNRKEDNLGIPLPKGTVRVYKRDSEGSLQFVGEDTIDHTPKDEKVRIKVGEAFDVTGSRKQVDWEKIAYDTYEAAFEISLGNHKNRDVTVKVIEPIPGDWTMLNSSHPYKKTDAFGAEFDMKVPKDKTVTLSYRVRMKF